MRRLISVMFLSIFMSPAFCSTATAIFAGGCFWCMEPPFDKMPGVISTTSGYTGGHLKNPTYDDVTSGKSGHYEAVKVVYDPDKVNYAQLLKVYWRNIDPLDDGGQFCDRGNSYESAIFYLNDEQKKIAEQSKAQLVKDKLVSAVVTPIIKAGEFYPAEEYHQNYYQKNPVRYRTYRYLCGRDKRLQEVWTKDKAQ